MNDMFPFIFSFIAFLSSIVGCAYLALSQNKHAKTVTTSNVSLSFRQRARLLGWLLIFLSYVLFVSFDGFGFALLLFPLAVGAASWSLAVVLAYRPNWLLPFVSVIQRTGSAFEKP